MDVVRARCELALRTVRQGAGVDRRFAEHLRWGVERLLLLRFDSDWMTDSNFVEHVRAFLNIEGSRCACLWRLDADGTNEPTLFFVHEQTTADEYRRLLAGKAPVWLAGRDAAPGLGF